MATVKEFIGVSWNKFAKKWGARIRIENKYKHLGYFTNEKKASEVYQRELSLIN